MTLLSSARSIVSRNLSLHNLIFAVRLSIKRWTGVSMGAMSGSRWHLGNFGTLYSMLIPDYQLQKFVWLLHATGLAHRDFGGIDVQGDAYVTKRRGHTMLAQIADEPLVIVRVHERA